MNHQDNIFLQGSAAAEAPPIDGMLEVCLCDTDHLACIEDESQLMENEIFFCFHASHGDMIGVSKLSFFQNHRRVDRIMNFTADVLTWETRWSDEFSVVRTRLDPSFFPWIRRNRAVTAQGVVSMVGGPVAFEVNVPIQSDPIFPPARGENLVLYVFFGAIVFIGILVIIFFWALWKELKQKRGAAEANDRKIIDKEDDQEAGTQHTDEVSCM